MNNKISGDFDTAVLESFRSLYAQREVKPEELERDAYTGLPTDVVTNISPWISHTGLWKANPGTDRGFIPNQVLEVEGQDIEDTELTEDEFNSMVEDVLADLEEEEAFANEIYRDDDEDMGEEDEGDEEDEELERLIQSIMDEEPEELEDDDDEVDLMGGEEDETTDEELERMVSDILQELEEIDNEEEDDDEVDDEDLQSMIDDLMAGYDSEDDETEYELDGQDEDERAAMVASVLDTLDIDEDFDNDDEGEEQMTEEEIDQLIDSIMNEEDDD